MSVRTLDERFPKTLASYRPQIDFVAKKLDECGVADLERLATALFVRKHDDFVQTPEDVARKLTKLKASHFVSVSLGGRATDG